MNVASRARPADGAGALGRPRYARREVQPPAKEVLAGRLEGLLLAACLAVDQDWRSPFCQCLPVPNGVRYRFRGLLTLRSLMLHSRNFQRRRTSQLFRRKGPKKNLWEAHIIRQTLPRRGRG